MKFGQIIFSVVISALIFTTVWVTENARFTFKNSIKDPFETAEKLDRFIENDKNSNIDIFSKDGEFFRLYPKSIIDFSKGNRELLDGELFISSQFVSDRAILLAQKNFKAPFNTSEFTPKITQFKLGKIFISIPNSSVYIKREKEKEQIKIYALDHSIEIFLENAKVPFVLPANMMVNIRESILSHKTGYLYYTKLKKELGLTPSALNLNLTGKKDSSSVSDRAILALKAKEKINKLMKYYAENIPQTWLWFENQYFIGPITTFIQNTQIKLSIGYPRKKIEQFKINKVLKPFVSANIAIKNGDIKKAKLFLDKFNLYFKTKYWFKLIFDSSFEKKWNTFTYIQKSWIRSLFPDDPANIFVEFWSSNKNQNSIIFLENKFNSIELLLPKKQYIEAANYLIEINKSINTIELTENDLKSITKLRRILFELIKEKEIFQKKEIFELYGFFIKKEVSFYENEEKDEIQLESAQDILLFLDIFLNREDKADISSFLVNVYGILNVDQITEKRNRLRIFTEKELELIKIIKNIGSTGLTEDAVIAFNKQKQLEEQRRKLDESRLVNNQESNIFNKNIINSNKLFIDYLKELKIKTQKIKITKNKNTYKFSNAIYKSINVSGTFDIESQKFRYLKVGNEIEKNISKKIIKALLVDMEKNNYYNSVPKNITKTPPQNTPRAITDRDSVKSWFNSIGVIISLSDIEVLDFDYNKFKIKNSTYNKQVKLSFVYYKDIDVLEDLIIQTGRSPLEIPYKIKRNNLKEKINKSLFKLMSE